MRKLFTVFFSIFLCFFLEAQETNREVFDEFLRQSVSGFESFRDSNNEKYAVFLLSNWELFHAEAPVPKPVFEPYEPVVYVDTLDSATDRLFIFDIVASAAEQLASRGNILSRGRALVESVRGIASKGKNAVSEMLDALGAYVPGRQYREVGFPFFGAEMKVRVPDGKTFRIKSIDPDGLSKAWRELSKEIYNVTLADCIALRQEHNLCDWAFLNMLDCFSRSYLSEGPEATFLTAYLYTQSGYKMRLGINGSDLHFLFGTDYTLFDMPYYRIDGTKYYVFGSKANYMSIANIPYPEESDLSLMFTDVQNFGSGLTSERSFVSDRFGITSHCSVNQERIRFFDSYPDAQKGDEFMTRWAIAANIPLGDEVTDRLYPELKRCIDGKNPAEATDMLLDFVQTSLTYKVDDVVWGRDRVFVADETLYYPYCDCEDRSILFSVLVRDLLGLEVALVYYPNHLATAVKLPEDTKGDALLLPSGRFVICDPSYIGASIGKTIPGMDNSKAKIILL